jgi:radical SAM superfamily enzyme YgiQ (UPF0313 family)
VEWDLLAVEATFFRRQDHAMPRLLLINPINQQRTGFTARVSSRFPPLNLGIIAALTPSDWNVSIIDENHEVFSYEEADLVGITAFTSSVNRGYEIASHYREAGIPTVMGGIHASMCPEEALQFVDSVVVGEAESIWQDVLADFHGGKLRRMYRGIMDPEARSAVARRELFHPDYRFASIQTSRGCPLDCDFCSVTAFNGRRYRRRNPACVLAELESISHELLFFVDDNLIGYGSREREQMLDIFRGMVERRLDKKWFCQASLNVADDPEVLEWAARAGCRMIFLGIEAEDTDALASVNKKLNLKRGAASYSQVFDRIHAAGIAVLGAFVFGMDSDTPDKLRRRAEFIINSEVDVMQTTAMTPLPGTRLYTQLEREGRLLYTNFPDDWDRYNLTEVVMAPKLMSVEEMTEVMRECLERIYDMQVLKAKAKRTLALTGRWDTTEFAWQSNLSYREIALAESTFALI